MIEALRTALANASRSPAVAAAATVLVAATWLLHGLYHKLLGGSPRHLAIVQSTPGLDGAAGEYALAAIGAGEVAIAAWVLAGCAPRLCAAAQSVSLMSMNLVELAFARDLLLWPAALVPANLAFLGLAWLAAQGRARSGWRARVQRHPVDVRAHFSECVTLTYALPAHVLRPLVPPGLELETLRGYGFVAVALVQAQSLRPRALPAALGQDFFLAGYRVFTTFRRPDGRRLRGLRILRSDTNRTRMVVSGNLLTHYQYRRCDAAFEHAESGTHVVVRSRDGAGNLDVTAGSDTTTLPPGSPFTSVREARRFAGPLPFTFDYEPETHGIVAIEAARANWHPQPIEAHVTTLSFFDQAPFRESTPILAAAFRVRDIDYTWKRGRWYPLEESEDVA